jgi:predicted ATPase
MPARGALPLPWSSTYGRAAEITELTRLVRQERLVTLTGSPGGGKTRLAQEVGRCLRSAGPDDVRFVDLVLVRDPGLVANAVADALGVQERSGQAMDDTLVDALARVGPIVLLLDNCEHVLESVARLAVRLISGCPGVRVLATSRARLGVAGEWVHDVGSLAPAAARELFVDRARRASPSFRPDASDRVALETVCGRLGGLPLLIELTAAWTRVLSTRDIVDRLDDMAQLLAPGARGVRDRHERHADLAGIADWSLRLVEPAERELFAQLSVFVGSFDLPAVEAVAGPGADLLAGLASLVDHSLVLTDRSRGGPMRYRLLEPLRQYGAKALLDGDVGGDRGEAVRGRHAQHYLDLARRCDPNGLEAVRPELPLARLEAERGNLATALAWARARPGDMALRLCLAATPLWEFAGPMNEGRVWLDEALATGTSDGRLRVAALERAVKLAWRQGDYPRARTLLDEGLAAATRLGDPWWLAITQATGALVALATEDIDRAVGLCEASIAGFGQQGGDFGLVWVQTTFGWVRYVEGRLAEGYALMERSLEANVAVGNPSAAAAAHLGMAYGAFLRGDPGQHRRHLREALAATGTGGCLEVADWLGLGAALAATEGRHRSALRLLGGSRTHARNSDSRIPEPIQRPVADVLLDVVGEVGADRADALIGDGEQLPLPVLTAEVLAGPDDHVPLEQAGAAGVAGVVRAAAPRSAASAPGARGGRRRPRSGTAAAATPSEASRVPAGPRQPPADVVARFRPWLGEVSVQVVTSLLATGALALLGLLWTLLR